MNRRLEEFDLDEAEKVEDNNDNGEAIEEGNVVAEPQAARRSAGNPGPGGRSRGVTASVHPAPENHEEEMRR